MLMCPSDIKLYNEKVTVPFSRVKLSTFIMKQSEINSKGISLTHNDGLGVYFTLLQKFTSLDPTPPKLRSER